MTTLRPERSSDGPMSYDSTGQFKAVVEQMDDPLNDPLPGHPPAVQEPEADSATTPRAYQDEAPYRDPSPYEVPAPYESTATSATSYENAPSYTDPSDLPYAATPYGEPAYPGAPEQPSYQQAPYAEPAPAAEYQEPAAEPPLSPWFQPPRQAEAARPEEGDPPTAQMPVLDDEQDTGTGTDVDPGTDLDADSPSGPGSGAGTAAEPPTAPSDGGRAARRKAARQGGGHRGGGRGGPGQPAAQESGGAPLSRVEARRAARAAKEGPAVIASRIAGELFITLGVLMLLFVTYQLWWTNVRAHREANAVTNNLQHEWDNASTDPNRAPGTYSPGEGFAVMYIPKLDVRAPIAQGISKQHVLDKGEIGHYDGALNTAMPSDKTGNFAVAAHRNTHGEPFRYINRLVPGDKVVVETGTDYYTYEITSSLASTPPSNISVLKPIPVGSGFTKPGRYLTLTTCTPEFTSTNRLIVWGKLIEDRPRSKGKPDALVNG